jgi:hypothetical protein
MPRNAEIMKDRFVVLPRKNYLQILIDKVHLPQFPTSLTEINDASQLFLGKQ